MGRRAVISPLLSIKGRLLVASMVVTVVTFFIGGVLLSHTYRDSQQEQFDAQMVFLLDSMIGAAEVAPDGVLVFSRPVFDQRFNRPYSGFYWQISEEGEQAFRSRSLWDFEINQQLQESRFEPTFLEKQGPDSQMLRVLEQDIILPETDRVFRFSVGADLAPFNQAIAEFNRQLLQAFVMIGVTIIVTILLQVSYGLKPLVQLRRAVAQIRTAGKSRIEGKWPSELSPVIKEMNELIDHNNTVVTRARTHAGNLAHALKTPLTILSNAAQQDHQNSQSPLISEQVAQMQEHIDHHLRRAQIAGRSATGGVAIAETADKIVRSLQKIHPEKKIRCQPADQSLIFAGEQEDLFEVLGNLLENAAKWSAAKVSLSFHERGPQTDSPNRAERQAEQITVVVEDDGPGVDAADYAKLVRRGERLDETVPGSGLGLSIVFDVVDMYSGTIEFDKSDLGGLKVLVTLPLLRQSL